MSRFLFALSLCFIAASASAAEPTIRNLNVRGLTVGGATTLTVDGDDLGTEPRLLLPIPAKADLAPKATDKQAVFTVTLPAEVTPGFYQLRVQNDRGVSPPVVIAVDKMPQLPFAASVENLPAALHGAVGGSQTLETKFPGKSGQKILVDVEAARLGSKLKPVVHLIGPKKLQLAWAWSNPARHGDCRIEATLPDDGLYSVTVHDTEYNAAAPSHFRLKIGAFSTIDQVFPPAVTRGASQPIELFGTQTSKIDLANPTTAIAPLPWPKDVLAAGPRPFVTVSPFPELLEQPKSDAKFQDLPAAPVAVSGKLLTPLEEDVYRIPVTAGQKLRIEVFAERIGSPLDVALMVRNEEGGQLARVEDSPGTFDPIIDSFAVPAKGDKILVAVADAQGRGGPTGIYRLRVTPQKAVGDDFDLLTPAARLSLPANGRGVVPILVRRLGHRGPITLSADKLPAGFKVDGAQIPADAEGALVTLQRDASAAEAVIASWTGKAENGLVEQVRVDKHPLERIQPWLADEVALAPISAKLPNFTLDWRDLPADTVLKPGKKLTLPVKFEHGEDKVFVKLNLLTSQLPVLANNQVDANQMIRAEKPANEFDAKARQGDFPIVLPANLVGSVYDVAIQAELLAADKKTVLAIAYTPVRRLELRVPLVVNLEGPPKRDVVLDPKMPVYSLKGTIQRVDDMKGDVVVQLAPLPPGVTAAPVTVKAADTAFELKITLPPTPGELGGMKLSANAADPGQPNVRLRSRDVDVTLNIKGP